jgi:hypothetical protein
MFILDPVEPAVVPVYAATRHDNLICLAGWVQHARLSSHLSYCGGYLDLVVGVSCDVRDSSDSYWKGYDPLNA